MKLKDMLKYINGSIVIHTDLKIEAPIPQSMINIKVECSSHNIGCNLKYIRENKKWHYCVDYSICEKTYKECQEKLELLKSIIKKNRPDCYLKFIKKEKGMIV